MELEKLKDWSMVRKEKVNYWQYFKLSTNFKDTYLLSYYSIRKSAV